MTYFTGRVTLRDTVTDECRSFNDAYLSFDDDGSFFDFQWSENNYSCDCNRRLFFERAGGREPEEHEMPCGEGRFLVVSIIHPDGRLLYTEESK